MKIKDDAAVILTLPKPTLCKDNRFIEATKLQQTETYLIIPKVKLKVSKLAMFLAKASQATQKQPR